MTERIEDMLVLTWGDREADGGDLASVSLQAVAEQCWPDEHPAEALALGPHASRGVVVGRVQR